MSRKRNKRGGSGGRGARKVYEKKQENRVEVLETESAEVLETESVEDIEWPSLNHLCLYAAHKVIQDDEDMFEDFIAKGLDTYLFKGPLESRNARWKEVSSKKGKKNGEEMLAHYKEVWREVIADPSHRANLSPLPRRRKEQHNSEASSEHECSYEGSLGSLRADNQGRVVTIPQDQAASEKHKQKVEIKLIEEKREEWLKEEVLHRPLIANLKVEKEEVMSKHIIGVALSGLPDEISSEYGADSEDESDTKSAKAEEEEMKRLGCIGLSRKERKHIENIMKLNPGKEFWDKEGNPGELRHLVPGDTFIEEKEYKTNEPCDIPGVPREELCDVHQMEPMVMELDDKKSNLKITPPLSFIKEEKPIEVEENKVQEKEVFIIKGSDTPIQNEFWVEEYTIESKSSLEHMEEAIFIKGSDTPKKNETRV